MGKRVAACCAAAVFMLLCAGQSLAVPVYAQTDQAQRLSHAQQALNRALEYLQDTVTQPTVGSIGGEWAVLALAQNDCLDSSFKQSYLKNLQDRLDADHGVLSTRKSTEYARVVRLLAALGCDPVNFAGYNLLDPLTDLQFVCLQGINGPVWALLALDSCSLSMAQPEQYDASRQKLIGYLLAHQLPQGGWGFGTQLDDMNAMAIQALAPYYQRTDVKQAIDQALERMSLSQQEDGGFGQIGGAESNSQVILALTALGPDWAEDTRFVKNGNAVVDALLQYQKADGSFCHVLGGKSDSMATEQAVLALTAYCQKTQQEQAGWYIGKILCASGLVLVVAVIVVHIHRTKKKEKSSESAK